MPAFNWNWFDTLVLTWYLRGAIILGHSLYTDYTVFLGSQAGQLGLIINIAVGVFYVRFRVYCTELQAGVLEAIETFNRSFDDPEWKIALNWAFGLFLGLGLLLPVTRERFVFWATTVFWNFVEFISLLIENPVAGISFVHEKIFEM
jgi:hypothetical protein